MIIHFRITLLSLILLALLPLTAWGQSGYVESFDDNTLTNWQQVNSTSYTVEETNQELQVSGSSTTSWHNLEHTFTPVDITGNPVVKFRVKTNTSFDLRIDLGDGSNNIQNTVENVSNSSYQTYTMDFSGNIGGINGANVQQLVVFFNPGANFSGEVDFDYFVVGDSVNTSSPSFAGNVRVNQVGYEKAGPKRAVFQSSESSLPISDFHLIDSNDDTVFTNSVQSHGAVGNWNEGNFWSMNFSAFDSSGTFRISFGGNVSHPFDIGENLLFDRTAHSVVQFFDSMRCRKPGDASLPLHDDQDTSVNAFGGWWDANGDPGKHFSHLSFANHFNPQQTPLVTWSLLKSYEMYPTGWSAHEADLKEEAAWGADYILRNISPEGFVYLAIFDDWGGAPSTREICEWGQEGNNAGRTANYEAAFREGAGISIAALARAARMNLSAGDSTPAQYLAGAKEVYAHLTSPGDGYATKSIEYCNNHKPNIIDHYTALMAATELFRATNDTAYLEDARARVDSLLARVNSQGWWESDANGNRPYYHAAEEGMPLLALAEFKKIDNSRDAAINTAFESVRDWYFQITEEVTNPFYYVRQYGKPWNPGSNTRRAARKSFFIPQENETEYWWQGENARLASMSTGFLASALSEDPNWSLGTDSLSNMVMSQLNWILGSNPYGRCFLYGFGEVNYPIYLGNAYQTDDNKKPNFHGGICNGISAADGNVDGYGIDFAPYNSGSWQNWRWVEQWLPHDCWYLLALTYLAKTVENEKLPVNLMHFNAGSDKGDIALSWTSRQEREVAYYDVQRLAIDEEGFKSIINVNARNQEAQQKYMAEDHKVQRGQTYLYRLKIVNNDGSHRYSKVERVTLNAGATEPRIVPNPAVEGFSVQFSRRIEQYDVRVTSIAGQQVLYRRNVAPGEKLGNELSPGIYLIYVSTENSTRVLRMIKR